MMTANVFWTDQDAGDINTMSAFLARRDLPSLSGPELERLTGKPRADLLILLRSAVVRAVEIAAEAYRKGLAERLMIAGGNGHSTEYLRENIRRSDKYGDIAVDGRCEAEILRDAAVKIAGLDASEVLMETASTNCGNNAEFALRVAQKSGIRPETIILIQDPVLQQRTHASFLRHWSGEPACFLSWAPFVPEVEARDGILKFKSGCDFRSSWTLERFLSLVMGEIPRLRGDERGYGPRGRGFITRVEIPSPVLESYGRLESRMKAYSNSRSLQDRTQCKKAAGEVWKKNTLISE